MPSIKADHFLIRRTHCEFAFSFLHTFPGSPNNGDGEKENIRIVNNTAVNCANGISIHGKAAVRKILVRNNISYSNREKDLRIHVNEDISDITEDRNLFGTDPLFMDPAEGNYTLKKNSPAVDAGHPDTEYNDPDGTRNDHGFHFFDQPSGN